MSCTCRTQGFADKDASVVWVPDEGLLSAVGDEEIHATQRLSTLEQFKPEEWGLPAFDKA